MTRHSGGPAQWGATVALIVFVVLAAAGHKEIGAMLHVILTVVEIAVFAVAGAALLTAAVVIIRTRRRAARRARADRVPVVTRSIRIRVADADRPVLDSPRRPAPWPLPGRWHEITPGDHDDRRRYS